MVTKRKIQKKRTKLEDAKRVRLTSRPVGLNMFSELFSVFLKKNWFVIKGKQRILKITDDKTEKLCQVHQAM